MTLSLMEVCILRCMADSDEEFPESAESQDYARLANERGVIIDRSYCHRSAE